VKPERVGEPDADGGLAGYPLLDALRGRRSRRFGMGMKIPDGPFAYESHRSQGRSRRDIAHRAYFLAQCRACSRC
jgi:hypothetical protein